MHKIESFKVNHLSLDKGIYISKIDDGITTLDLRMRKPYADTALLPIELHSLEHLLATSLRSGTFDKCVVYVGPMGCATGFYVLFKDLTKTVMLNALTAAFKEVLAFEAMPGNTQIECGNCNTLDLAAGKAVADEYLTLLADKTVFDTYT